MTTKTGVKIEKLLNKKPYERFDYIRLFLKKRIEDEGKTSAHLEMSAIKKSLGVPSHVFTQVRCGHNTDISIYQKLASIVGEDVATLIEETPKAAPQQETVVVEKPKAEEKKEEQVKVEKPTKQSYTFENHTDENLSIVIKDGIVHIYFNEHAPKEAKIALLRQAHLKIGGNEITRTFPEVVKL